MMETLDAWVQAHSQGVLGFCIALGLCGFVWCALGFFRSLRKSRIRFTPEEPNAAWWYKSPSQEFFRKARQAKVDEALGWSGKPDGWTNLGGERLPLEMKTASRGSAADLTMAQIKRLYGRQLSYIDVGDMDPDEVIKMLNRMHGSLPSVGQR
jgi:hypothetical protein